jgi:hypothetical protein
MAEKAEQRARLFDNLSDLRKNMFSVEGAKKVAAWYIDTSEKLANGVLDFQASTTEWAKETPLAPIIEAQQELGRKFVKRSAEVARTVWQLNN